MPKFDLLKLDDEESVRNMWEKLDKAERLHLALTCSRFRKIFEIYDAPQYASFKMESLWPMSFRDIEYFSKLVGPKIEVLSSESCSINNVRFRKFLSILTHNCNRVRCIVFKNVRLTFACYELFAKAQNLTELHLPNCKLTDKDVDMIIMLPNLLVLNLSNNDDITGNGLHVLRHLKALYLSFCNSLEPRFLIKAFRAMRCLAILDIQQAHSNTVIPLVYDELSVRCLNLDKLRVSLPENVRYENLARLRKLTQIYAFGYVRRFIIDLRNHKAKQLTAMHLESLEEIPLETTFVVTQFRDLQKFSCAGPFVFSLGCIEGFESLKKLTCLHLYEPDALTHKAVFTVMRKCPKLRFMLACFKENVNEAFIYELIDVLGQRPVKMLFVLNLQHSQIRRNIVKEPCCVAAKSVLDIKFCPQQFDWDG